MDTPNTTRVVTFNRLDLLNQYDILRMHLNHDLLNDREANLIDGLNRFLCALIWIEDDTLTHERIPANRTVEASEYPEGIMAVTNSLQTVRDDISDLEG